MKPTLWIISHIFKEEADINGGKCTCKLITDLEIILQLGKNGFLNTKRIAIYKIFDYFINKLGTAENSRNASGTSRPTTCYGGIK